MSTVTNTVTVNLSMSAIRKAMPEFFNANIAGLVAGLAQSGARIATLSDALTGAAIERAQSGNMPQAWATVDSAALALKGTNKVRVTNALAHVLTVKPASEKHDGIEAYQAFAKAMRADILATLTPPPAIAKDGPAKESAAQKIARLEGEVIALTAERDAFAVALNAANVKLAEYAPATA